LANAPQRVFLAGSSAGAEAVLHAAFYDREAMRMIDHGLGDMRFAGVISGAGALVSTHLVTEETVVPLLLFHGTDDPLVPYGAGPHHRCAPDASGWLMLFGAGALADRLDALGAGSYALYQHEGAGHEIAGRYFHRDYGETLRFIRRVAEGGIFRERYLLGD
jgi:acetyl esterase/lipase